MIGTQIGRVQIQKHLGRGGMGDVYLGFDEGLEREVAVKTLTETRRLHPQAKARLLREARLLSKLDHPGICRIHDLAEAADIDCLILEYIEGRTLREMAGQLTRAEVLDLLAQVADALAAAHSQEVVHRDLKPDNIMVTPELRAKVLDFGIARSMLQRQQQSQPQPQPQPADDPPAATPPPATESLFGLDDSRTPLWPAGSAASVTASGAAVTNEGALVGTVRYMSPEQARGEPVSAASDLYAFGVMVHEITSGHDAYDGATGTDLLARVARAETTSPSDIDPDLARLIDDLENLDPRRRPTATATAERLRWILDRPQRERRQRARRILATAAAVVAIVTIAAIGWRELRARRQVTIAQQFAAEARDITWTMRAEHLSPLHDLAPARAEVTERAGRLRQQMEALGRQARGPGELALGQVHRELNQLETAREHLDAAWDAGVRTPEAAFARGVVLGGLYHLGLERCRRISDPEAREAEQARLRSELRDPALDLLNQGLEGSTTPPAYIEGLIDLCEGRYEDGLDAAARLAEAAPWMYEAQMLEGELHFFLGSRVSLEQRDAEAEVEIWERGRDAYRAATRVGRSFPNAWARLCGVETKLAESRLLSGLAPVTVNDLDAVVEICEQAVFLDPQNTTPHLALAGLSVLKARVLPSDQAGDPSALFVQARQHADRAVELDPEAPTGHLFSGWVSYWLAYNKLRHNEDPRPAARRAIERYGVAAELLPNDTEVATLLGDAYWIVASWEMATGGNTGPIVDEGLTAIAPAVASTDEHASLGVAHANLLLLRGQLESNRGQLEDAVSTFELAAEIYRRIALSSSASNDHRVHAEAERRLAHAMLAAGHDPQPALENAHAALDRALELDPAPGDVELERGALLMVAAQHARQQDGDGTRLLDRSIEQLETAVPKVIDRTSALQLLGTTHLNGARWRLEDGRSPVAHLAAARDAFEEAHRIQPTWVLPQRQLAAVALLEGRWLLSEGTDPSTALTHCAELLRALSDTATEDAESLGLRAKLRLQQARWLAARDLPIDTLVQEGLRAADQALAINPQLKIATDARQGLRQLEEGT